MSSARMSCSRMKYWFRMMFPRDFGLQSTEEWLGWVPRVTLLAKIRGVAIVPHQSLERVQESSTGGARHYMAMSFDHRLPKAVCASVPIPQYEANAQISASFPAA